jgi:hypothetical protein
MTGLYSFQHSARFLTRGENMKFEEGIGEVELIRADPTDSTDSEC